MMNLLAQFMQQSSGLPSGVACVVSCAGISNVNGNYLNADQDGKYYNENNLYYIAEYTPGGGEYNFYIFNNPGSHWYYSWPTSQGLNPLTVNASDSFYNPAPKIHT